MKEDIKKQIMDLLKDKKARDAIEIIEYLNLGQDKDSLVMEIIQEMLLDYDLYMTKHGKYMNFIDSEMARNAYKGTFESKGEYGFVIVSSLKEDIFIPRDYKNSALDGDIVLASITKGEAGTKNAEGKILKVLKRNPKTKVGEVCAEKDKKWVILRDAKNIFTIPLIGEGLDKLVVGDLVTVKISNQKEKNATAIFEKRIGNKNDPGIDIVTVLAEHDFDIEFPSDVLLELETIPSEVTEEEMKGRVDLRDEMIFTIDGDDTKDIDDAISVKRLPNNHYELGVHIADVSYYVKENSPLDKEARKRGTSVYLADRVVPMLPHQLSNGICSLNPNVDRLTISCVSEIDEKGNIVTFNIFESVIKSRIQMTYTKVNQILEKNTVPLGYEDYADTLKLMYELAKIIRKNKINKGYIDFDVDEAKIVVDSDGHAIDVVKRYRGDAEKLIEDFMIIANECVATYIYNMDLPGIYRVHGEVNIERLRKFIGTLSLLGINVKENLNNVNQKAVQKIISEFHDHEAFQVLSTEMLSCMDKAKYQTNNIGHFALALRNYTHFTSPIRRYPDTTTHRLLREYFFKSDGITEEKINHFANILDDVCLTSSERERASMECEREVDDMKMAEYMESHIGETFKGMVSGVVSYGMFVMLPDKLIEGLVRIDSMDEGFFYDANTESLVSKSSSKVYTIGSKVTIKVIGASHDTGRIDFCIEKDDNSAKE